MERNTFLKILIRINNQRHAIWANLKPAYHNVALHFCRLNQILFLHFFSRSAVQICFRKVQFVDFFWTASVSSQPDPLGSEPVHKWVGLQPNGLIKKKGKQRGLSSMWCWKCVSDRLLPPCIQNSKSNRINDIWSEEGHEFQLSRWTPFLVRSRYFLISVKKWQNISFFPTFVYG